MARHDFPNDEQRWEWSSIDEDAHLVAKGTKKPMIATEKMVETNRKKKKKIGFWFGSFSLSLLVALITYHVNILGSSREKAKEDYIFTQFTWQCIRIKGIYTQTLCIGNEIISFDKEIGYLRKWNIK